MYQFLINGISDDFSTAKDLQEKIADLNHYKAKFEKAEIKIKVKWSAVYFLKNIVSYGFLIDNKKVGLCFIWSTSVLKESWSF